MGQRAESGSPEAARAGAPGGDRCTADASMLSDATLLLETSFALRSAKYAEKKPHFALGYVRTACAGALCAFLVAVSARVGRRLYAGHDSSAHCFVETDERLVPGERYVVYGRVRGTRARIVEAVKTEPVDYKKLCYRVF